MKFCSVCDNMMYMRLAADEPPPDGGDGGGDATAGLRYFCKNCGFHVDASATDTKDKVLDTDYRDDQATYSQYATPNIVHDPTLPRVSNIPCPFPDCSRAPAAPNEVIYVKYDATNLRFLYFCCHCSRFWKSGAGSAPGAPASDA